MHLTTNSDNEWIKDYATQIRSTKEANAMALEVLL